jgi:hypothetical protein
LEHPNSVRVINKVLYLRNEILNLTGIAPLAFLAPALVRAVAEGRLPRNIGVERLPDVPAEWSRQFEALG